MLKKIFLPLLFLIITFSISGHQAYGQEWPSSLSEDAQIMLLTVSPGQELYSLFGHSALRIYDPQHNLDRVFNYGTFDFEPTLAFYWSFIKGRLDYLLVAYPFEQFLREYRYENRSVVQQTLELNDSQKNRIYHFLVENQRPENRAYKYDFFYDNCSTRIRDIFEYELQDDLSIYPADKKFDKTYRDLVHEYTSGKPWADLGIKLILGHPSDKRATGRGYLFLPDYMMSAFDSAVVTVDDKQVPFVSQKEVVLQSEGEGAPTNHAWYQKPIVVMWAVFLPLLVISIKNILQQSRTRWIDFLLYKKLGLVGLFFLFCWFGTDHAVAPWNLNMLWAFPAHIVMALFLIKAAKKPWVRGYFLTFSVLAVMILLNWFWLPQPFHTALIPLILLIALRGIVIYRADKMPSE